MASSEGSQSRGWCITSFGVGEETSTQQRERYLDQVSTLNPKYAIGQLEVCPDTGRYHIQGFVYCIGQKSFTQIQSIFEGAHLQVMRGTPKQAWDYCCKEDTRLAGTQPFYITEPPPGQGKRTDWNDVRTAVRAMVTDDKSDQEIMDEMYESHLPLWVANASAMQKILDRERQKHGSNLREAPEVIILHGVTGSGKTMQAWEQAGSSVYAVPTCQKGTQPWFDNYQGQPHVLLDEMPWEGMSLQFLLRLLDRYPLLVPVKGAFVAWRPTKIWMTSNLHPDLWYPGALPVHTAAFQRRVSSVTELGAPENASGAQSQIQIPNWMRSNEVADFNDEDMEYMLYGN